MTAGGGAARRRHQATDPALFFRRWRANPLQMGSIIPSPPALCGRIARLVERAPGEVAVELGAGSGIVSHALLAGGVPADRLVVIGSVAEMVGHPRSGLPGLTVICGDAFELARDLPMRRHGRVGIAICGIPLAMLPLPQPRHFVAAVEAVAPGRGILLYRYCVASPLPYRKLGLTARHKAWTPLNVPPASVWRYQPER